MLYISNAKVIFIRLLKKHLVGQLAAATIHSMPSRLGIAYL